jgi:sec-independent protein translocase protein TatB
MFDIGFGEVVLLAAAALFIFGPDKLPQLARDAARTLRALRQMISSARRDLSDQLGPEFDGIDLTALSPRTFLRKQLLDDLDVGLDDQAIDAGDRRSDGSPRDVGEPRRRDAARLPKRADSGRPDAGHTNGERADTGPQPARDASSMPQGERPPYDADAT